jgi:hypothetical protein
MANISSDETFDPFWIDLAVRVLREIKYAPGETIWNEYDVALCVLRAVGLLETHTLNKYRLSILAAKEDYLSCKE